jgi:hypothetical protein
MMKTAKVNVVFESKIVGVVDMDVNSGIYEIEIELSDLERAIPDYDPAKGFYLPPDTDINTFLSEIYQSSK